MEACVLICRKNKPAEKRQKVQFINAKHHVTRKNGESYLEPEHIQEIVDAYNRYENIEGLSAVIDQKEIEGNKCMLKMGLYVSRIGETAYSEIDEIIPEWLSISERIDKEMSLLCNLLNG